MGAIQGRRFFNTVQSWLQGWSIPRAIVSVSTHQINKNYAFNMPCLSRSSVHAVMIDQTFTRNASTLFLSYRSGNHRHDAGLQTEYKNAVFLHEFNGKQPVLLWYGKEGTEFKSSVGGLALNIKVVKGASQYATILLRFSTT